MPEVLKFSLSAPLASWGVGGATIRPTQLVPTHSAIIGLLASALGLARNDERQVELSRSYARAVQIERTGLRLTDYHTVQTPHRAAMKSTPRTRADELRATSPRGAPWTSITNREYVQDAKYTIVLWPVGEPPWTPADLKEALLRPRHSLYAGRRSCVLDQPLSPEIVTPDALDELFSGDGLVWDSAIPAGRLEPHHEISVNDNLLSPTRRAFSARQDYIR